MAIKNVTTDASVSLGRKDVTTDASISIGQKDVTTTSATSVVTGRNVATSAAIGAFASVQDEPTFPLYFASSPSFSAAPSSPTAGIRDELRVIVAIDPPNWTEAKSDSFTGAVLDRRKWASSWLTGPPQTNGACVIRSWALPLFEWIHTRDDFGWFPSSPLTPFKLTFNFAFHQVDPVYVPPLIVGAVDNDLGDLDNPVLIYQQGSAMSRSVNSVNPTHDGKIQGIYNGSHEQPNVVNNFGQHEVVLEWDPAHAVNGFTTTIKYDGSTIYESNNASWPRFFHGGWSWDVLRDFLDNSEILGLGTPAVVVDNVIVSPVVPDTIMSIYDFSVEELDGLGYEALVDPEWTIPNQGATGPDDALPGEIFEMDGLRWAIIPPEYIDAVNGERSSESLMNTAALALNSNLQDDILNWQWGNRAVLIDTRRVSLTEETPWVRQMAGFFKKTEPSQSPDDIRISLSINSMVEDKLNVNMLRAWRGNIDGIPAVNEGYVLASDDNGARPAILNDMLEVADAVHGGALGDIDYDIKNCEILLSDAGTLGNALLPLFEELVDKCGLEAYVRYFTSGAGRYGLMRVHAGTLGSGVADFTFDDSMIFDFKVSENVDEGPGQINLRQNLPDALEATLLSTFYMPTPGLYPTSPYPMTSKIHSDSIAFAYSLQATGLQILIDKDGNAITGGIASHLYKMMNTQRRVASFTVWGQHYLEPSHEVDCQVALSLPGETWVIRRISWSYSDSKLESQIVATTTDWQTAITRAL